MDVTVRPMPRGKDWSLIDLLGRSMGRITEDPPKHFTIYPDGQATETMAGLSRGPYASLDSALSEIETHTRGVCPIRIRLITFVKHQMVPPCTGNSSTRGIVDRS